MLHRAFIPSGAWLYYLQSPGKPVLTRGRPTGDDCSLLLDVCRADLYVEAKKYFEENAEESVHPRYFLCQQDQDYTLRDYPAQHLIKVIDEHDSQYPEWAAEFFEARHPDVKISRYVHMRWGKKASLSQYVRCNGGKFVSYTREFVESMKLTDNGVKV